MQKDLLIKAPIPFLKGKSVLLLEDPSTPIPVPEYYWEDLKYKLEHFGYHFIVLPELLSGLNPVVVDYLFPGYEVPDASAIYRQISSLAGISDRNGFLYKKGRYTYFKEILDADGAVRDLLNLLHESLRPRVRKSKSSRPGIGIFGSIVSERRLELYDEELAPMRQPSPTSEPN